MLFREPIVALFIVMAATLYAAESPGQHAAKKDLNNIQGTWGLTALESDGMQGPAEIVATLKLVFKDDTLTFVPGEPGFTKFKVTLDPTTKPAGFNMSHADEGKNKGKTLKAIYWLDGDRLKICFGNSGKRPKMLTAKAKSKQSMYTLQREKLSDKREAANRSTDEQR